MCKDSLLSASVLPWCVCARHSNSATTSGGIVFFPTLCVTVSPAPPALAYVTGYGLGVIRATQENNFTTVTSPFIPFLCLKSSPPVTLVNILNVSYLAPSKDNRKGAQQPQRFCRICNRIHTPMFCQNSGFNEGGNSR